MNAPLPTLTIGLPVFNGEPFLRKALNSILAQDFKSFVVLASDNASTDRTHEILEEYKIRDPRINFVRQSVNVGAVQNFNIVSDHITTPYFMWFAADDEMAPGFLSYCINALERNDDYGMAFSTIVNIDGNGRAIREYPKLSSLSGKPSVGMVTRFVLAHEIMGKANLIYSVYRTPLVRKILGRVGMPSEWGGDMCFVLAAILEAGITISPEVLFRKRYVQEFETAERVRPVEVPKDILSRCCPTACFDEYRLAMLRATKDSGYAWLVRLLMGWRRIQLICLEYITNHYLSK